MAFMLGALVKSQTFDDEVKSSRGKARKSLRSEAYWSYAAMTKDVAQRSLWTFDDVVMFDDLPFASPQQTTSPHGLRPPPLRMSP
jgi:hypothetical protein